MAAADDGGGPQRTHSLRRIYTKFSRESSVKTGAPNDVARNMAADQKAGNDSRTNFYTSFPEREARRERLFRRSDSVSTITNRLVEMLDHIEKRVELLRDHACSMEQERDTLISMLHTVRSSQDLTLVSEGEREEIEITAQRLMGRTLTVEVCVTTPRNEQQQKALERVNTFIDELVTKIQTDLDGAKKSCYEYLNACLPEAKGPINQKFQSAVIECTADDQKKIRKRLESLLATIAHAENSIHR